MSWYLTTHAGGYFVVLHNMLTGRPEVPEVHCVKDAKVGISIDLPYAQLKVMSVPENVDETSWRSLSGVHANKCILQLIPNMKVSACISSGSQFIALSMGMSYLLGLFYYRSFNHCCDALSYGRKGEEFMVMLWLTACYLGFLEEFIWPFSCPFFFCQRYPNARLSGLISCFFGTFAFWDRPKPIILQDGMLPISGSAAEPRSLMPIRLPCTPHEYCHSNIIKSTFNRIRVEFLWGHTLTKDLLRPDFDWGCPFGPFPCAKKYTRFLKICLSASKQDELGEWVGWVKLRFRSLLVKVITIDVVVYVIEFGKHKENPYFSQKWAMI
ncbi:hypothetical protein RHMOL_Rhmol05G0174500 [Rhododendron molle]|uniref:Uncharacterized protein n=1 Tax=Rhododendron molle TaxID=49168 RepID=A0ACC0NQG6_RHOML|nr:hypothetical protein RHMOL_Rhmol05G0174500 [Rhododendron molle]